MSGDDWDDFYIPPESDGPPLVGEDWIAAATRDQLQAECRRLSEVATHNLQRAWKAERTAEPPDGLREAIATSLRGHRYDQASALCACGTECGIVCDGLTREQHLADALLAGPLAPLLAKLQAVEALAARARAYPPSAVPLGMLLRALGGGR